MIGLYSFSEHSGNVIYSQTDAGRLYIPQAYAVFDKVRLKPFWDEFELTKSYANAVHAMALDQDNLTRIVDAYTGSLQSIIASSSTTKMVRFNCCRRTAVLMTVNS